MSFLDSLRVIFWFMWRFLVSFFTRKRPVSPEVSEEKVEDDSVEVLRELSPEPPWSVGTTQAHIEEPSTIDIDAVDLNEFKGLIGHDLPLPQSAQTPPSEKKRLQLDFTRPSLQISFSSKSRVSGTLNPDADVYNVNYVGNCSPRISSYLIGEL